MTGHKITGLVATALAVSLFGFSPDAAFAQGRGNGRGQRPQQRPRPDYHQFYYGYPQTTGRWQRPRGSAYNGYARYPEVYNPVNPYQAAPPYIYYNGVPYRRQLTYWNGTPGYRLFSF